MGEGPSRCPAQVEHMGGEPERRIDPADGEQLTREELGRKYIAHWGGSMMNRQHISAYWKYECKPAQEDASKNQQKDESHVPAATLVFRVDCEGTKPGESVYIVGSVPELGSWEVKKGIPCSTTKQTFPTWTSVDVAMKSSGALSFKVVIAKSDGCGARWESGDNKVITVDPTSSNTCVISCAYNKRGIQVSAEKEEADAKEKVKAKVSNTLSQELTVEARVAKNIVSYDIYCGVEGKSEMLKRTRYSELNQLHEDVIREVPEFRGQLPRKTFWRRTSAGFVESRRVDIQAYLRVIAVDSRVLQSKAFQRFFQVHKQCDLAPEVTSPSLAHAGYVPEQTVNNSKH